MKPLDSRPTIHLLPMKSPTVVVPFSLDREVVRQGRERTPNRDRRLWRKYQRLCSLRSRVETSISNVTDELRQIEPTLFETHHTLVGPTLPVLSPEECNYEPKTPGSTVAGRNAEIFRSRHLSTLDICKKLDFHSIPVPEKWEEDGITTYVDAYYRNDKYRNRLQKLISLARRHLDLP